MGYKHTNNRKGSLFEEYKNTIDVMESKFWVNKAKKEYFFTKIIDVIKYLGLDQTWYMLVTNNGRDANQEVPHFHVHILGGEKLGSLN